MLHLGEGEESNADAYVSVFSTLKRRSSLLLDALLIERAYETCQRGRLVGMGAGKCARQLEATVPNR